MMYSTVVFLHLALAFIVNFLETNDFHSQKKVQKRSLGLYIFKSN